MKWIPRAILIAAMTLPSLALAWGGQGHRMVGKLAAEQLTPQAQAAVARILAGEPDPTLGGVASWADNLRDVDPALARRTAGWHFINMGEESCVYQPAKHCKDGNCVIAALTEQARLLADPKTPPAVRRDALKWVVHLTGDLYQPMHAGFLRDKGGNDIQLQFDGKGTNLHRVWDSEMFYQRHLKDEAYMDLIRPVMRMLPPIPDMQKNSAFIAKSSCEIDLHSDIYPKSGKLEPAYIEKWRPVAERRIAMAAQQLAEILNRIL